MCFDTKKQDYLSANDNDFNDEYFNDEYFNDDDDDFNDDGISEDDDNNTDNLGVLRPVWHEEAKLPFC